MEVNTKSEKFQHVGETSAEDRDGVAETDETDAGVFKGIQKGIGNLMCGVRRKFSDLTLDDMDDENFYGMEEAYKRTSPLISREEILSDTYKMDYPKRGKALVFNNKIFSDHLQKKGYTERKGTDIDATKISRRLQLLGFDVEKHQDLTVDGIFKVLKGVAKEDHGESDCFACVILSHGQKDVFFGYDGEINLKDIFELFKGNNCNSLVGKPKLFFIQACRGHMMDKGIHMNVIDAQRFDEEIPMPPEQNEIRIPNEADFLIAYSTVPGFYSWRNSSNGSWFIQGLVRVLDEYGTIWDIMHIMTRVNRLVAYNFQSNTLPNDPDMHQMKQASCVTSMLTKDLFFIPKKDIMIR